MTLARGMAHVRRSAVLVVAVLSLALPIVGQIPALDAGARIWTGPGPVGNGRIALVSTSNGQADIYTMLSDSDLTTNITTNSASDREPAWAPNGSQIAFISDRDGNDEVYVMDADGANVTRLTNDSAAEAHPAWSPDGGKIAYDSNRTGVYQIYLMNSDGTSQTRISDGTADDRDPAWAPDRSEIAFTSRRDGNNEIYVMKPSGTGTTRVTDDPSSDFQPAWSPDSQHIVFSSNRTGNGDIYMTDVLGTIPMLLVGGPAGQTEPVFSPDHGTRLAYISDNGATNMYVVNVFTPTGFTYGRVRITDDGLTTSPSWQALPPVPRAPSPIRHVVIVYLENHSFDNVFGKLCVAEARCNGATQGRTLSNQVIDLLPATNHVPRVSHSYKSQQFAINGGLMNGWEQILNCSEADGHLCYQQFDPTQIPILTDLARNHVISDETFETDSVGSWGSHLDLAASVLDGFYTAVPRRGLKLPKTGWGCDSNHDSDWAPRPQDLTVRYPTCIPFPDGTGAYRKTMVPWVPTIMDRLTDAGQSWKIYAPTSREAGYGWSICPTFSDCLYTGQAQNMVATKNFLVDAAAGTLGALSIVVPKPEDSEHNNQSMLQGDNWIGAQVNAVMQGPQWGSTAIFVTYDDCGCFYDHVRPPYGQGIRVPMVIVSPYAKASYTDSNVASIASMMAFVEHNWGLAPTSYADAEAYDYSNSFDYTQLPLAPTTIVPTPLSQAERRWIRTHRFDRNDPT